MALVNIISFIPGNLFLFSTCSAETSLGRHGLPLFPGQPVKVGKNLKTSSEETACIHKH